MSNYNIEDLKDEKVESCISQIKISKLEKKNILENSDQLVVDYYKLKDFITSRGYTHSISDILEEFENQKEEEYYLPHSTNDIFRNCYNSLERLYQAGYK